MVKQTIETYGRLDCAFNNAGSGTSGKIIDLSETDWDFEINANLKLVWLSMKYEIPTMQQSGGGAIVNMSSQGTPWYCKLWSLWGSKGRSYCPFSCSGG